MNQYEVKVKRMCVEVDYEFLGFFGEYRDSQTRLSLRCQKHNVAWDTTSIANFTAGGYGCPECASEKLLYARKTTVEQATVLFMETGVFVEGTTFCRSGRLDSKGESSYWHYTCPKCSTDEYVEAGVCSGVFESTFSSLQKGSAILQMQ